MWNWFFLHEITHKIRFNSEYACRISLIHLIWSFFFFSSALSSHLTLIIGVWIHGIKSMWRDYVNSVFLHEITHKNTFQHWIRVSNKFNSHDMCVLFFSALSSHLTLNIVIWIHGIKLMKRDCTIFVFLHDITPKSSFNSEYACRISSIHMLRF